MIDILFLIIPYFGLILLGTITALLKRLPEDAMGWLNVFIIYLALPALFIKLLSQTPVEELASWTFILTNLAVTGAILLVSFAIGLVATGGRIGEATIQGLAGAYGNIGYMGPGLAILAFGEQAAVPVALIFCFENIMHFTFAPVMMALSGETGRKRGIGAVILDVLGRILGNPFILATGIGVGIAVIGIPPPTPVEHLIGYLAQAAAPCALFAMGVTLAMRPVRRVPPALLYLVPIKLVLHPLAMFLALSAMGPFDPVWAYTAILLAALPTATNVFVIASQYGIWSERAATTILATTGLSVLTVSLCLYLMALEGGLG